MKGRKLTLEEVLKLEDGSKVWVESKDYGNKGQLSYFLKEEDSANFTGLYDEQNTQSDFYPKDAFENLDIYEWIEGVKSINISGVKGNMNGEYYNVSIVNNMAQ